MKTKINHYEFNISNQIEKQNYINLWENLKKAGYECFQSEEIKTGYSNKVKQLNEIELETEFIFNNQWNTAPTDKNDPEDTGLRVFDWYEWIHPNKNYKCGYYLTITEEMVDIRRNTYQCGFCAKYSPPEEKFCKKCLDSPYLKEKDLKLLKLESVADKWRIIEELTKEELHYILPLWKEAQLQTKQKESKNKIIKIKEKYKKAIVTALTERDGFLWLISKNINTNNVIYYPHTNKFCFGWKKTIKNTIMEEELKSILTEFPYQWEIE